MDDCEPRNVEGLVIAGPCKPCWPEARGVPGSAGCMRTGVIKAAGKRYVSEKAFHGAEFTLAPIRDR